MSIALIVHLRMLAKSVQHVQINPHVQSSPGLWYLQYTLLPSRVLKTEEGQIKSRSYATPTIELVQTGPGLILKFKEMAINYQKPSGDPHNSN